VNRVAVPVLPFALSLLDKSIRTPLIAIMVVRIGWIVPRAWGFFGTALKLTFYCTNFIGQPVFI